MLCLGRTVGDPQSFVNIKVIHRCNPKLVSIIRSLGGDPDVLNDVVDTITVQPTQWRSVGEPARREIVLGFNADRHVEIIRSEVDRL